MKRSPIVTVARGVAFCLCIVGCSAQGSTKYLRGELANKGPHRLSLENPYYPPNLLLARELQTSSFLRGFVDYRGAPDAIEVRDYFLKPVSYYFFYLDRAEAYRFQDIDGDWAIVGPEPIPESVLNTIPGGQLAFAGRAAPPPPPPPPPSASSATPPIIRPKPRAPKNAGAVSSRPPNAPANAQTALLDAGDLEHRVSFPGETLRMISGWYTGDVQNTSRLARMNGIENPDLLVIGQVIRIPRYLLKNAQPLPRSQVENYIQEQASPAFPNH